MLTLDRQDYGSEATASYKHIHGYTTEQERNARRFLDFTRYSRRGKALLRKARGVRDGTIKAKNHDRPKEIASIMREARWCFTSASRLVLVRRSSGHVSHPNAGGGTMSAWARARLAKR